jgi:hypothetical protein
MKKQLNENKPHKKKIIKDQFLSNKILMDKIEGKKYNPRKVKKKPDLSPLKLACKIYDLVVILR